jgi:hypothetical protein
MRLVVQWKPLRAWQAATALAASADLLNAAFAACARGHARSCTAGSDNCMRHS